MLNLVIVGGSDAGISAALRARELAPNTQVTMLLMDEFPNYSICGLPFYLSGEVPDWRRLAHRTLDDIEQTGIRVRLGHTVTRIRPDRRVIEAVNPAGQVSEMPYDRLIIATGAEPVRPPIEGLDTPGVYLLHSMADSFAVERHLAEQAPKTAAIIGAGYIGLEMADALRHRGLEVVIVEQAPAVLPTVDTEWGRLIGRKLEEEGVRVLTDRRVDAIRPGHDGLSLTGTGGLTLTADLVIVVAGVRPLSALAAEIGVPTGIRGAIQVTRRMETRYDHIYAAGDCVETWHRLLERPTYIPLGTTAHKQGRVAGENAVGGDRQYAGTLGTQVVKVFDWAIARTGLRDDEARERWDPLTVELVNWDHKVYYPDAHPIRVRITGDRASGRLLGAQIVGHRHGEVSKRIDIFAAALTHSMTIDDLNDLDLSYTPPFSSPWDPVQMSAQAWMTARGTR